MASTTRRRNWVFTLNNYNDEHITHIAQRFSQCSDYVFQEETGANGTRHLQGAVFFKSARTFSAVKRDMPNSTHIEPMRGTKKQSIAYCTKRETRTGSVYSNMPLPEEIKDPLEGREPYPWQQAVLNILSGEPDDRTIYWFWEPDGNVGKSALVKHICITNPRATMVSGKSGDVKFMITTLKDRPKVILWDLPRSMEDYVSYTSMEEVKNGLFASTKYESKMVLMNCPHVICFANFPPDYTKMSGDRWNVTKIEQ